MDAISFTGSRSVGLKVACEAAPKLTRAQLELGSKNALVVLDDAELDVAVSCAVAGAFSGTGQKCTASSRIVVERGVHDAFVERFVAATRALKVDHALKPGTQIGPVVSAGQLDANLRYVALARKEGGEVAVGGERLRRETEGYYMAPAVVIGTRNGMRVNREEMFAPIACVIRVDDYGEALATVNDADTGLSSAIVTRSLARATHFRRNAETGCVMVNLPTAGTDYHVPFTGRKTSSLGPGEQGFAAMEFYTQTKTSYVRGME